MDVTDMRLLDHTSMKTFTNGRRSSYLFRMRNGEQVYMQNVVNTDTVGLRGTYMSILGSGLIDGGIQLGDDLINKPCLSPNQRFWRSYVALIFGLAGGLAGTAAVMFAVTAGAPAIVAGGIGFGVGLGVGWILGESRKSWLRGITTMAGGT